MTHLIYDEKVKAGWLDEKFQYTNRKNMQNTNTNSKIIIQLIRKFFNLKILKLLLRYLINYTNVDTISILVTSESKIRNTKYSIIYNYYSMVWLVMSEEFIEKIISI